MSACPSWCTSRFEWHVGENVHGTVLDVSTPITDLQAHVGRYNSPGEDDWFVSIDLNWEIEATSTEGFRDEVRREIAELRAVLDNFETRVTEFADHAVAEEQTSRMPGLSFDDLVARWPHLTAGDVGHRIPRHTTTNGTTYWLEDDVLAFIEGHEQ